MKNSVPKEEKAPTHDPKYHWDREEHIIVMDAYLKYRPQFPDKESEEIQEISNLLRQYHPLKGNPVHDKLRNGKGIYMKMMNFRRFDPTTESKGLENGNKLEESIWDEFYEDQEGLRKAAELIRESIRNGNSFPEDENIEEPEMETEGRVKGNYPQTTRKKQKK